MESYPLSVIAGQNDTMDDFYKQHHVEVRIDSTFYKDDLFSVSSSKMNKDGIVLKYAVSHLLDSNHIRHVKEIKLDEGGVIVEYISFTQNENDTSAFLHKKLLSRNNSGAAEMIWYTEFWYDTSMQKNFDLPMVGYRYLSTKASRYWSLYYATDNYMKYEYNDTGALISTYQIAIHHGDTLFKQKINFSSPYNMDKYDSEEWIYAENKLSAYSKHDRNFQISESVSFTNGKVTEHHQYENKYNADSNLVAIVVFDCMGTMKMREMEIKINNLEITITPEVGFETHDHLKHNPYWDIQDTDTENGSGENDLQSDSGINPYRKTKQIEGGFWCVELYRSSRDRIPYKTIWYDNNKMPLMIYYQGQMVEKISYSIRK